MIGRRTWPAVLAGILGLALLGGASSALAEDPVAIAQPAGGLVGLVEGIASRLSDGSLEQGLDGMVGTAASNPCSGSGFLQRTSNGSVTVLLLGSDYRDKPYIGERTDTVIVLNIAKDGRVAMAAIPRDTVRIPLHGGGTSGSSRVNSLYARYKRSSVGRAGVDCTALDKVRKDVAKALGTSIPYYAMIRMDQFESLINSVGGLRMNIRSTLIDYHYARNSRKVYVPKSTGYQMNGSATCGKKPIKCRDALRYARSRHGTEGGTANSDFRRIRRQQEIVYYAIKRVLARGNGSNLTSLLAAAKGKIYSNLPKTASGALALYSAAQGAHFSLKDGIVFGPRRWASYTGRYTFQLKLSDVRGWVDHHFKPGS